MRDLLYTGCQSPDPWWWCQIWNNWSMFGVWLHSCRKGLGCLAKQVKIECVWPCFCVRNEIGDEKKDGNAMNKLTVIIISCVTWVLLTCSFLHHTQIGKQRYWRWTCQHMPWVQVFFLVMIVPSVIYHSFIYQLVSYACVNTHVSSFLFQEGFVYISSPS